jgi:ubiquinone biosynthesis protein COQ9
MNRRYFTERRLRELLATSSSLYSALLVAKHDSPRSRALEHTLSFVGERIARIQLYGFYTPR